MNIQDYFLTVVFRTVLILTFLLVIVPFVPMLPSEGLDPSWVMVISQGLIEGKQWGRDIIFTYGPLGILQTRLYTPYYYTLVVPVLCLISVTLVALLKDSLIKSDRLLMFTYLASFVLSYTYLSDVLFLLFVSAPIFHIVSSNRVNQFLLSFSIILLGMVSLIKTTYFLFSVGVVFLVQCYFFYLRYRFPYYSLLYLLSFVVFWVLAKQDISNLADYIYGAVQIVAGYGEAMSFTIPGNYFEIALFIFLSIFYVCLMFKFLATSELDKAKKILLFLLTLAFLFVVYKQGFTRHDLHSLVSWFGLVSITLTLMVLNGSGCNIRRSGVVTLLIIATAVNLYLRTDQNSYKAERLINNQYIDNTVSLFNLVAQYDKTVISMAEQNKRARAILAEKSPISSLDGSVDIIESMQGLILSSNLEYKSRPIFQEYSAYTPWLQERNRNFFLTDGPDYLLFSPASIDWRLPALAEGSSWPTIFSWYQIEKIAGKQILLARRSEPLFLSKGERQNMVLEPDSSSRIMLDKNSWMFAKIKFNKTFLGRLIGAMHKLPPVFINYYYDNNITGKYRIVPGMTEEGFYISPVVNNSGELLDQLIGICSNNRCPNSFSIDVSGFWGEISYDSIEVELTPHTWGAEEMLSQNLMKEYSNPFYDKDGNRYFQIHDVFSHAPSILNYNVAADSLLSFKYGIREGAADKMKGVCFSIQSKDGSLLFSDCITQQKTQARVERKGLINIKDQVSNELLFKTECYEGDCSWAWSFWGIDFPSN